jgi:hypothetical protein
VGVAIGPWEPPPVEAYCRTTATATATATATVAVAVKVR